MGAWAPSDPWTVGIVMDAQTSLEDAGALAALVQALALMEVEAPFAPDAVLDVPEVIEENRFLAARDGMDARLVDPRRAARVPVRELAAEVLWAVAPYAERLGSRRALEHVGRLVRDSPAGRQRALATRHESLTRMIEALSEDFVHDGAAEVAG